MEGKQHPVDKMKFEMEGKQHPVDKMKFEMTKHRKVTMGMI